MVKHMMCNLPVSCATLFQNWQCHMFHGSHPINRLSRIPMGFLRPGMVLGAQRCRMDPWKTESERDQSQTCTSNSGIVCVCGLVIGCKLFDMIVFCCWDRCWLFFELFLCFSSFSFDGCAYGCAFVYTSYLWFIDPINIIIVIITCD